MRRLLTLLAVAALATTGAACSDDDGDDGAGSTTATTSTTEAAAPTDDDEPTEPTDDPEGSSTTTTEGEPAEGDLAGRVPEVEGLERQVDEEGEGFGEELCDGSAPSVEPVEQTTVSYFPAEPDASGENLVGVSIVGHVYEGDEAAVFYDEFVRTTAGCDDQEGLVVDGGAPSGIGEQGQVYRLAFDGEAEAESGGAIFVSLAGDEVWLLSLFGGVSADQEDVVVGAFTEAVEGG
jgi:hypothetical protein